MCYQYCWSMNCKFFLSGVDAATSDPAEGMGTYYKRFTKTNEQERGRVYEHKDQGVLYRRSGSSRSDPAAVSDSEKLEEATGKGEV